MGIDLNQNEVKETPAIEAKQYPLAFMRLLSITASNPMQMRAYSEFCPFRRITGDVEVIPAVQNYDVDGNPTDITPAVTETRVVGAEFKTPEVQGDITVIEKANIMDLMPPDPAMDAKVEATIQGFMADGGNLASLAFAAILLTFKMEGIAQGKFVQP